MKALSVFKKAPRFNKNMLLPMAALLTLAGTASAGSGGTEFNAMYTMVRNWAEGGLGKLLAVAAFLIGMGMGIVKQSIMAVVLGIGFALTFAYAPGIIDAIFTFAV